MYVYFSHFQVGFPQELEIEDEPHSLEQAHRPWQLSENLNRPHAERWWNILLLGMAIKPVPV